MNFRKAILNVLTLCMVTGLHAQQHLSLQDVISIGLENNYSIRIAKNNQQVSDNNYSIGHAGFLPSVDLRTQYSGTYNNTDRTDFDGNQTALRNIHNTVANANAGIGWTIFDGFRVQVTYDKLAALKGMGELNTRIAIENLVATLTSEYFNLIQQKRLLNNLKFAVDLSRERVRIDEERFLLGSGSKLQLLQAEVFLNADSSRMTRQEEVVRASRIRLNELMAMEDLRFNLQTTDTIIPLNDILIFETLEHSARLHNAAMQLAQKNKAISEYDRRIASSQAYPYVHLSSAYAFSHNTFQSGTFSDQQTYGMNYGITIGINLFDGFNQRRRVSNATIAVENSRLRYEDMENSLMSDLITTYNIYLNNLRLVQMESQNLGVSYETLDIAMERYRLGDLSGIELREVQKNLLEAEERLVSIQYQAKLAEIALLHLSGRILEYL